MKIRIISIMLKSLVLSLMGIFLFLPRVLYPATPGGTVDQVEGEEYLECPDIPSPYTREDGTEIITGITEGGKYVLIPVTQQNGESLDYRKNLWGKGGQLKVNVADFPTLAKTGLHAGKELDRTRMITGLSIAEITLAGRPGCASGAGFMAQDEDIISVLKGDNRLVREMDLTHRDTAKPLFHLWNILLLHERKMRKLDRPIPCIESFLYNGRRIRIIDAGSGHGWQESIFRDDILGYYQIEIVRDLDAREQAFIDKKYGHLGEEGKKELKKMLSYMHTGEMVAYYIMRYGFYEGHTGYRADPIALAFIFGLKSLEELDEAFEGDLYGALTEHFTRNIMNRGE